jgi:hypothetical protein
VAEDTKTSLGTKIILILALVGAVYVLTGVLGGVLRWAISLIGYIIVGFIGYQLGKISGKHGNDD